jgi:tRNA threonylcarbamoyladenosine biosynthesis protein TsaE
MATFISHSPDETAALGEQWGRAAESGVVIGLSGDLGAGKTQWVKGLARGLGIAARVHSPTFALVNIYNGGRLTLFHLDLYRLESRRQIAAAGLEEYLNPAGVTVIEWAERWFGADHRPQTTDYRPQTTQHATRTIENSALRLAPGCLRWVQIDVLSESERRISYEDSGA